MHQLSSPGRLFADLLAAEPTRPFVTYYSGRSGERSELSTRSLANWVAKTHFLIVDELGLGPGERAFLALPPHWISVPVALGCWTAGLVLGESAEHAAVGFVTPETAALAGGVPDVYAVSPEAAARGFGAAPPDGTEDYVAAVRPQADSWASVRIAQAADAISAVELEPGARLLLTGSDWIACLQAVLRAGGSMVIAEQVGDLDKLTAQERVTARWTDPPE